MGDRRYDARPNTTGGNSLSYVVQTQLNAAERQALALFFLEAFEADLVHVENPETEKALVELQEKIRVGWNGKIVEPKKKV